MADPKNESLHLLLSLSVPAGPPFRWQPLVRSSSTPFPPVLSVPLRSAYHPRPPPSVRCTRPRRSLVQLRYHMAHMHACMHACISKPRMAQLGSGQGLGFPSLRGEENRSSLKSCPTGWALGELTLLWSTTRHPTHSPALCVRLLRRAPPRDVCTRAYTTASEHTPGRGARTPDAGVFPGAAGSCARGTTGE